MKIYNCSPLTLQTYPTQPEAEVCSNVPATTPSFFIPRSHPVNPYPSLTRLSAIPSQRHRIIAFASTFPRFKTHSASGIEAV
jgi:hypothetical protein